LHLVIFGSTIEIKTGGTFMRDGFFEKLQDHSEVKLSILKNYIVPWMRKITLHKSNKDNKCLLIDGFAGCGIYEDGEYGSPLIMIEAAIEYTDQCRKYEWAIPQITIRLNELDISTYKELIQNICNTFDFELEKEREFISVCINHDYENITLWVTNKSFEDFFSKLIDLKSGWTLIPSICFIDPFGYSNTPFSLIRKYMSNEKAELIINFMYEEINRFITLDSQKALLDRQFGCDISELSKSLKGLSAEERQLSIIQKYTKGLKDISRFANIQHFILRKTSGQTKMILFFATKSKPGLECMKEAMFKHSSSYSFDPRKKQLEIYELPEQQLLNLSELIYHEFKPRKKASIESVEEFTLINTVYPITNYSKNALKILEADGKIYVNDRSRKNTYPKYCIIYFV
jgi:three-Cys-motif partner protein